MSNTPVFRHFSEVKAGLEHAEKICKEKNLRFTPIRRHVLELILSHASPTKAYDLLDKMGPRVSAIKPATIYRALDFLLKNGLIHKVNTQNAYFACSHQQHESVKFCILVHCMGCGKMNECHDDNIVRSIFYVAGRAGFAPSAVSMEVEGKCARCA